MIRIGIKVALFAVFMTLLYFVGDYFINLLRSYIPSGGVVGGNILPLACQLGILTGVNIFLSMALSAFVIKSVLSYVENL